ncbi:xanthine dehydrogenase family protein molybdopterin-binding subunit [Aestuariibius sp. 2305UL40-4]|uniref:xanthine dehydrogenase family protein molybdopterin-binding subunit n=1 Tax=Aestuariibius violaceus TaxID=3234132 RepID=UPI00345EF31C
MEKFGKSQAIRRVEDLRFLTGQGGYVDDIAPEGALFAYVLRSSEAHGTIASIDAEEARGMPGVHLVLTAADLAGHGVTRGIGTSPVKNIDGSKGATPKRPLLAEDRVRFVGEAVAFVVADTLAEAKDAAEAIMVDIDSLDPHVELAEGGPLLHDEVPGNLAFDWGKGDKAAVDAALDGAAHRVRLEVEDNRIIVNSMEPRGCFAEMLDGGRLHVANNGQGVWDPKRDLAKVLEMEEDAVRVTNPDTGGGFGMKSMSYPEMFLTAIAARALGQPVRWMAERTESMLSDNAGRDLISTAELGFDADHRIVAYKVETLCNLGAHNSQLAQYIQSELFAKVLMGCYDVQATWLGVKGVFTNTTPVDAYRGAGRPEAIYVLERVMDHAARQLGVDAWELRRKNFIRAEQFPYKSATGEMYDVGDFARVLGRVADEADRGGFAARKAASEAEGKLRGMGLCYYIESILGDPSEGARVVFTEDGAEIHVGTQSNGQGHETAFAKFLSDQSGIPMEKITVIQGDSDVIAEGGGTGGSRSATTQANATLAVVSQMVEAFGAFLAEREEVDPGEVSFDDERFRIAGSNVAPTMLEAAGMARAAGREDLLNHHAKATLPGRSYPNGAHVAEVEIDPATGWMAVVRYTVTDDFGNLLNPLLVEGQIHGGVAQGIGQAWNERVVYDENGQLLTATFMDYGVPRANDLPMIAFTTEPVPSTANPMGMKGCGEAGTVGALAAVANAVQDAVWDLGIKKVDMPFTPLRVWEMLKEGESAAA